MGVQILEAEDSDMDRIFEIASLAFARNEPFWDLTWPNHWTLEGRRKGAERMRKTKNTNPHTTYLKAVDSETGKIMGMAKWVVYNNSLPDLSDIKSVGDLWENEEDKAYAIAMINVFHKDRYAAIKASNGNLVSLDILSIDPAYQRRGVGAALVRWGTDRADELGVDAVVESSVFGKGLYEKNGFKFIKDVELWPDGWQHKEKVQHAWLVRPKKHT